MRIIKDSPNALMAIAGEIVNIEASELRFLDGKPIDKPVRGYPDVTVGNVRNVIRATCGYIVLPDDVDKTEFAEQLVPIVKMLSEQVGVANSGTALPHTVKASHVTNVKVISSQANTQITDYVADVGGNTGRVFRAWLGRGEAYEHVGSARFNWIVVSATDLNLAITQAELNDAIARHVCSVFYDRDDLCALDHNATVTTFTESMMRAHTRVLDQTIALDHRVDPALLNIGRAPTRPPALVEIPHHKLFAANMADLQLKAGRDELLRCSRCDAELWGDFYAMDGPLDDPNCVHSVPVCALCGHIGADGEYLRVLRVNSGRSRADVVGTLPPILRDILSETAKGVKGNRRKLIGDKYVAMDRKDFLFTRHPAEYAHRQLISVVENVNL